tara:strand:- start:1200 stop:1493 length:294 start_codon:yes stop_codon:yes gene_type:complete
MNKNISLEDYDLIATEQNVIDLKNITTIWSEKNMACFEGIDKKGQEIEIKIPLIEITSNIDYWFKQRTKYIIKKEKEFLEEKKKLKNQIKLWKSQII